MQQSEQVNFFFIKASQWFLSFYTKELAYEPE